MLAAAHVTEAAKEERSLDQNVCLSAARLRLSSDFQSPLLRYDALYLGIRVCLQGVKHALEEQREEIFKLRTALASLQTQLACRDRGAGAILDCLQ